MSKISIIIPVYNVKNYLCRCINSVLTQSLFDFDLILIDDGSPDSCGAICDEYASRDSRINVIHQANGGLSAARNAGLDWVFANSNSEWITFIDSDDWVHPQYLEVLYSAAQKTGLDIVIGGYALSERDTHVPWKEGVLSANPEIWETERFYCEYSGNAIVAWGKLFKRTLWEDVRFPIGRLHEDEFVIYKVLFSKEIVTFVRGPLYSYFQNPMGIIHSKPSYRRCRDIVEAIKEQVEFFSLYHFKNAMEMRLPALITKIYTFYHLDVDDNEKLQTFLRSEMKAALTKYKCQYPFRENLKYYRICSPFRVCIYKKIIHLVDLLIHKVG